MSSFTRKYSQRQEEALAVAYVDRGIRPYRRVVELAAAGELEADLDPFEVPESVVRDYARKLRARRAGQQRAELADMPNRDAAEALRLDLLQVAQTEVRKLRRKQKADEDIDLGRLAQAVRVVRELVALPDRNAPAPPRPGYREPGGGDESKAGGISRTGLAGQILASHQRATPPPEPMARPEPEPPPPEPATLTREERMRDLMADIEARLMRSQQQQETPDPAPPVETAQTGRNGRSSRRRSRDDGGSAFD